MRGERGEGALLREKEEKYFLRAGSWPVGVSSNLITYLSLKLFMVR